MPTSSVLVDESEAITGGIDLRAEGFTKMLKHGAQLPTADLVALIITPYDIEIVRRDAFPDGDGKVKIEQPKPLLAGTFDVKHPQEWLDGAARGLQVIVSPDLDGLVADYGYPTLSQCWFAQARILHAK
ncbi:hypothetical protein ACFCV3_41590 [Kribbella sp. NPDC056345]|uniref:hypothetical protein n=1 Tax=Kribbella sp. NPDC056345 TaxID=3345789 RepID=UPI0035E0DFCB